MTDYCWGCCEREGTPSTTYVCPHVVIVTVPSAVVTSSVSHSDHFGAVYCATLPHFLPLNFVLGSGSIFGTILCSSTDYIGVLNWTGVYALDNSLNLLWDYEPPTPFVSISNAVNDLFIDAEPAVYFYTAGVIYKVGEDSTAVGAVLWSITAVQYRIDIADMECDSTYSLIAGVQEVAFALRMDATSDRLFGMVGEFTFDDTTLPCYTDVPPCMTHPRTPVLFEINTADGSVIWCKSVMHLLAEAIIQDAVSQGFEPSSSSSGSEGLRFGQFSSELVCADSGILYIDGEITYSRIGLSTTNYFRRFRATVTADGDLSDTYFYDCDEPVDIFGDPVAECLCDTARIRVRNGFLYCNRYAEEDRSSSGDELECGLSRGYQNPVSPFEWVSPLNDIVRKYDLSQFCTASTQVDKFISPTEACPPEGWVHGASYRYDVDYSGTYAQELYYLRPYYNLVYEEVVGVFNPQVPSYYHCRSLAEQPTSRCAWSDIVTGPLLPGAMVLAR